MVEVGQAAPDFELKDGENKVKLSNFEGDNVLVAFFPFAFSPVCTKEMGCFEKDLEKLSDIGVKVVAISVDSSWSQQEWKRKLKLSFPVLSDFSKDVCRKYGVLRKDGFADRAYFLVDGQGVVKYKKVMDNPGLMMDNGKLLSEIGGIVS